MRGLIRIYLFERVMGVGSGEIYLLARSWVDEAEARSKELHLGPQVQVVETQPLESLSSAASRGVHQQEARIRSRAKTQTQVSQATSLLVQTPAPHFHFLLPEILSLPIKDSPVLKLL